MSRNLSILSALVLTFPIAIEVPYDSSGASGHVTRLSVAGGVGQYALIIRDCEGNKIGSRPVHFREVGADVEQQVIGPLHVGIRGGTVREVTQASGESYSRSDHYANPYIAIEGGPVGFGVGRIYAKESLPRDAPSFSGHLRIGGPNKYFSTSLMENVPLGSGGGYFDVGVGFRPSPRFGWWLGLSGLPYEGAGAAIRTAWQVNPRWTLDASARVGTSGGEHQTGGALGITSRFGTGKPPAARKPEEGP